MGKIVSIHSFRGGTGKSNTTANLAALAALAGKRVGVVDTDIQSPGIHVLFGLNEESMGNTLNDYLHGKCTIDDTAFPVGKNALTAKGRAKLAGKDLWLIPSSIQAKEISQVLKEGVDFNRMNEGLQTAINDLELDYLFIDTHPGLNEETLLSIAISDILIIIMRPDDQDIQGTVVTVDVARSLDVPNLFLLVNKALPKLDKADMKERFEATFQATVAGILPLTFDVAENASKDLFALLRPEHEWSKQLFQVSETILKVE